MKKKEKNIVNLILAISLIIIGMTLVAYHLSDFINFRYFINSKNYNFQTDKLGHFGDFIGGFLGTILTGIATYLVYITYISQKQELELQRKLIAQQQFESTFFNMLSAHRELKNNLSFDETQGIYYKVINVHSQIKHNISLNTKNETLKGLDVFNMIIGDFKNLFSYSLEKIIHEIKRLDEHKLTDCFDYTFLKSLDFFLENYSSFTFELKDEVKELDRLNEAFKLIYKYYENQIGHYCRNVYHILKYIKENEKNNLLGNEHKTYKNYADIFQSQLSVDEQFLLFYNFIYFKDESDDETFSTVSLVNQYKFLENIGIENLILKKHEEFYNFIIKGSDRKI
jgi:hypothetical protein